ncbi:MAG: type II toxin-antitoxin system HicB family antitoxin [Candidatus Dadabacteria bacterium]|nr:type II toxin-antitoxin system HicB family antitoxin [Candidatus Dadabacteria bacterium]MDE0663182.1 type II toxin-antitoxin system HicB family antitoxin [Candidatus Dadabacteria bacterium]
MVRYPALIDGEKGAYGVSFPDIPGVVAMGSTVDEALLNAEEALRGYVIETEKTGDELISPSLIEEVETPAGSALVSIPLVRLSGHSIRANFMLDEGVLAYIDGEARRRGMTRTKFVEWMTRRIAQMGG